MTIDKPLIKPENPCFSSGPCAKRPGWSLDGLNAAMVGRSHRAAAAIDRMQELVGLHRSILGIPDDYKIAIVPGGDTGAIEMAIWSMIGGRGVDVIAFEAFGLEWLYDIQEQLQIKDLRSYKAPYGTLPDLSAIGPHRDVVFTWNGTTGGVRVPDGDWIAPDRTGLTLCDATSAVFGMDMPWDRLDVTTWSWQKCLGGEAAHGMIVLSPRAIHRLTTEPPLRPLPRVFRLLDASGALMDGVFRSETINTPSMLAVEDCLDALRWVESIGGLSAAKARVAANAACVDAWVRGRDWLDYACAEPAHRSPTSICLRVTDPRFLGLDPVQQREVLKTMAAQIAGEGAGYDILSHAKAPPGLRLWGGATVETANLAALLPWIDWAWKNTTMPA